MKRLVLLAAMVSGALLTVGQATSFATIVFQFDEKGHSSLSNNGSAVAGVVQTTGSFDSLGGGTLAYTLPATYTFALAANVNQYAVLVTDSSSLVSDLLIFQNVTVSGASRGQVVVYDSPAAFASETGNGDLAKAYLNPRQNNAYYGDPLYPDVNYPNPASHPEYLNSPAYMQLALTHLFGSSLALSTVSEAFVNGGSLSGMGVELTGGDSTIKVNGTGTTTFDFFISEVPEPSTYFAGALLLLPFGVSMLRIIRRRQTA